jgi:putative DNA primase/helicase
MDRAVVLELRRKLPDEKAERLRHADQGFFKTINRKLARFVEDAGAAIAEARPALPDALNDRAQDNWEPLLAIADHAGGEWPQRAREAALKLSGAAQDAVSLSAELLADIREIFDGSRKLASRISTADLLRELNNDDLKPWATYNRGKPMTPRQLAKRLADYGIKSEVIRIGVTTPRGFLREWFEDAFTRYLPHPDTSLEKPATVQQTHLSHSTEPFSHVADDLQRCGTETVSATPNSLEKLGCCAVADKSGNNDIVQITA